jgi:hypothetical protein
MAKQSEATSRVVHGYLLTRITCNTGSRAFRSAIDSSFAAMLEIEEEYTVAYAHREEARNAWRQFVDKGK